MKAHFDITVTGRVQGVGFRWQVQKLALGSGIKGYVQNKTDGSVFIEAEGEISSLTELINWCHKGPDHAIVDNVVHSEGMIRDYNEFKVRR